MKEQLIEQWELFNEELDAMCVEKNIYTRQESFQNFNEFMLWLQTGRFSNGYKAQK